MIYSLFFSMLSSIINYYSEEISNKFNDYRMEIISFGTGTSLVYIFLFLLPEITKIANSIGLLEFEFVIVLAGFVFYYLIEKITYLHSKKTRLRKELNFEQSIAFFFYHIMVGIVFVKLFSINLVWGVLFGLTTFMHSAVSSLSMQEIHYNIKESRILRMVLSASTLIGTIVALLIIIPENTYFCLLSFITGVLLYIMIKDALPEERRGKPLFFLIGVLFYFSIFLILATFFNEGLT